MTAMDSATLELSAELRDELAANDQRPVIDPRTVPVRFSTLKLMSQSPAHYLHAVQCGGYEETLSMRIGSGAHAILFGQPYSIWTGKTRNGKAWDAFEADHPGLVLNAKEFATAQAMAEAIKAHPTASRLLFSGAKLEQRIDWTWQGRAFRSTPDAAGRTHLVDLKCLRSADPEKVAWQSRSMHYHAQAALYRRALNENGHRIQDCYLVVVENKAPHPVTVLRFTETALEAGDRSTVLWFERLRACEDANEFPGYAQSIVDLSLPETDAELVFGDDNSDGE
jgi:hypothetical protein